MKRKDLLSALRRLGLEPRTDRDGDPLVSFEIEHLTIVFGDQPEYEMLALSVPGLGHVEPDCRALALEVMNRANLKDMVVKTMLIGDTVALSYEHYAGSDPIPDDTLEHMIRRLNHMSLRTLARLREAGVRLTEDAATDSDDDGEDEEEE